MTSIVVIGLSGVNIYQGATSISIVIVSRSTRYKPMDITNIGYISKALRYQRAMHNVIIQIPTTVVV